MNSEISVEKDQDPIRHVHCAKEKPLVKVWVILDRPPNDPLLREKETFTSSYPPEKFGRAYSEAGSFSLSGMECGVRAIQSFFITPPMGGHNRGGRL